MNQNKREDRMYSNEHWVTREYITSYPSDIDNFELKNIVACIYTRKEFSLVSIGILRILTGVWLTKPHLNQDKERGYRLW